MNRLFLWLLMALAWAIQPPSPKYVGPAKWHGANNNKPITRLVVHATVGAEPGTTGAAEDTVRYSNATDRPSSYHYVGDAKHVLQYVYDSTVAYGAPPNEHSIHFELCCSLANNGKGHWEQKDHVAMLKIATKDMAQIMLAYGIPIRRIHVPGLRAGRKGICGHIDVSNAWHQTTHTDPGPYFPWRRFMTLLQAQARLLQHDTPANRTAVNHAVLRLESSAKSLSRQPQIVRKVLAKVGV